MVLSPFSLSRPELSPLGQSSLCWTCIRPLWMEYFCPLLKFGWTFWVDFFGKYLSERILWLMSELNHSALGPIWSEVDYPTLLKIKSTESKKFHNEVHRSPDRDLFMSVWIRYGCEQTTTSPMWTTWANPIGGLLLIADPSSRWTVDLITLFLCSTYIITDNYLFN